MSEWLLLVLLPEYYNSNVVQQGAHGQRGYHGNSHFVWVGAAVDIPYRVHKLLSALGPKIYVLRLPYDEPKDEAIRQCLNEKFHAKRAAAQKALMEYLVWFEVCPLLKEDSETGLPKIEWDSARDDPKAVDEIVRLAKLLGHLRCYVEVWNPKGQSHEYTEFGHSSPTVEDPRRAATCLYNLTRGYALTRGRNYITLRLSPRHRKKLRRASELGKQEITPEFKMKMDIISSSSDGVISIVGIINASNIMPHLPFGYQNWLQIRVISLDILSGIMFLSQNTLSQVADP